MRDFVRLCVSLATAILGDTRVRRQWMFFGTLLVLLFVFGGYLLAFDFLKRHPWLFALYLLASFVGLIFLIVFALFDMLMIRRDFREAKKQARGELVEGLTAEEAQAVRELLQKKRAARADRAENEKAAEGE